MSGIPNKFAIEWLVNRMHVSTPVEEVRAEVGKRIPAGVLDSTRQAMLDYAEEVHIENRQLYSDVMGARI